MSDGIWTYTIKDVHGEYWWIEGARGYENKATLAPEAPRHGPFKTEEDAIEDQKKFGRELLLRERPTPPRRRDRLDAIADHVGTTREIVEAVIKAYDQIVLQKRRGA
jgi:hypothetical protein